MPALKKILAYGFLVWLIPFVAAILIFPIHESNRPLFESIMPVVGGVSALSFSVYIFQKAQSDFVKLGVKVGLIWLGISLVLDLLMFGWGPMKMSLAEYVSDIGITYLMIPAITFGFGWLLEKRGREV